MSEKLGQQIFGIVGKRLEQGALPLPVPREVATRVAEELQHKEITPAAFAELVGTDPLLALRILRQATAEEQEAPRKLTLPAAVARVGPLPMRSALTEAAGQPLFASRDKALAETVKGLWRHSTTVAKMARDLAQGGGQAAESDEAYLAGLLHDAGKQVVAAILLDAERQITRSAGKWIDAVAWVETVGKIHRQVAVLICDSWKLPVQIDRAMRDMTDFDNIDRTCASNWAVLANALAKKAGITVGAFDVDEVDATLMIGRSLLNVDEKLLDKVRDRYTKGQAAAA